MLRFYALARGVGTHVFYDSDGDILEVIKNPDRLHVSRKIGRGVFVHLDPKTKEIVGFALHGFSRSLSARPMLLPFVPSFQPLKRAQRDLAAAKS